MFNISIILFGLLAFVSILRGADVGCNLNFNLDDWGTCTENGCCEFSGHETDPSLCDGPNEVCCYRNDLCPHNGANFCFRTYGTWVSRYNHHTSEPDVRAGFQALKNVGITRVYINIWADGFIYANSAAATANGAVFVRDTMQWAVDAARDIGLEIYAWFEYGTQAHYGTTPANSFAAACDSKGWLLRTVNNGYTSPDGGNYVYCDATQTAVRQFFADMSADLARNYDLDGIQYDDHMSMPSGFVAVDNIGQSQRFQIMEDFMVQIRDSVRAASPGTIVSYSPSPIDFSQDNHNVDWKNYLLDGIVDEVVPQYYRSTAFDYENTVNQDIPRVQGYQTALIGGIRLSGSGPSTPAAEVDEMIKISYEDKMKGISFWFADDLISGAYIPPNLVFC